MQQSCAPRAAAVREGRLLPRHAAYVEAFHRVGIHRHVAHDAMSSQQVQLELLVGNHSVGNSTDGTLLSAAGSVPARLGRGAGMSVGQVQQLLTWQPLQDGIVLPPAWQRTLQEGSACEWLVDTQQQWVQQRLDGGSRGYRVQQDGRLEVAAAAPVSSPDLQWVPCCVVDVLKVLHPSFQLLQAQQQQQQQQREEAAAQQAAAQQAAGQPGVAADTAGQEQQQQPQHQQQQEQQRQGRQQQEPKPSLFLVGPWSAIRVDPSVWGLGFSMGVLQFTVKAATQRLLQHHCSRYHQVGWVPGVGMRPRLWRNRLGAEAPQEGLPEMEAALKRSFADMQQGGARSSSSRGRGRGSQQFSDAALMEAYHAPWMDPSRERELPRQRAATAAAVVTSQRQQQIQQQQQLSRPACDDLLDPITEHMGPVDTSSYQWVAAYRRAGHKRLPRTLRVFGWRLLHAGVKVGARRMLTSGRVQPSQFACPAQQCQQQQQPQLETLSHLFVDCPVAAAAWQWFAQQWQLVQPGAAVPVSNAQVLLLDDASVWAPPMDKQQIWTYMRLLLLESIWVVRASCMGSSAGSSTPGSTGGSSSSSSGVSIAASGSSEGSQGAAGAAGSSRFTAKAVAGRFRAVLQQQLRHDWMRVGEDVRLGSGVPMAWLRGPTPVISLLKFWTKWGGLFTLDADGQAAVACSTAGL